LGYRGTSHICTSLKLASVQLVPSISPISLAPQFARYNIDYIYSSLSPPYLIGSRASPSVRGNYLSYTSVVHSLLCIYTVRSFTQYNISSILPFSAHSYCSLHRDSILHVTITTFFSFLPYHPLTTSHSTDRTGYK
jgi:hypothetical protein